MTQVRRTLRRLRSTTAAAAIMAAAAALVPASAQATMTFKSLSVTLSVKDTTMPPTGAVGGVRSPMEEGATLSLVIDASEAGAGLASAQASIGPNSASVSLCPVPPSAGGKLSGQCPESVSDVPLSIDVGGAGSHVLLVTVTDAAGNTGTLLETPIEVLAPVPSGSNTVTVGISARHGGPPEPTETGGKGGNGGNGGRSEVSGSSSSTVCRSPMLSMRLASRPVR